MLYRSKVRGLVAALRRLDRLEPQLRNLLGIIASRRGGIVSRDTIIDELWGHREDGGALGTTNLISVRVCQLRKAGFPIVNYHGRGWSLAPDWSKPAPRKARRAA